MKIKALVLSLSVLLVGALPILAKEVQVKGYTKKDGTVPIPKE